LTAAEEESVYSLARQSNHPHSTRIADGLSSRCAGAPVRDFQSVSGSGIEGCVEGRNVWIGSQAWLMKRGARLPDQFSASPVRNSTLAGNLHKRGHVESTHSLRAGAADFSNSVHVAIDGWYRGVFLLSSRLRAETEIMVARLTQGYEIALLSGDNEGERERFERLFGTSACLNFNQGPLDKLGFISRLQEAGRTVVMVGDGLNDAGALKQSDVGIAVVEKVGTFSPASDVILEAGQVTALPEILTFARRSARIVKISFGISAIYNVAGISIAAAGVLSPLICAVLMPISSVSVVLFACGATTLVARRLGQVGESAINAGAPDKTGIGLQPAEARP
jgi:Cu+-exporting ATPase